ncbi:hypothetical protein MPSEU_001073600 [Mayamaea pseudoterrestris]|nr:hypothetical protein MPSEU_001073600 [Mayamaea pseudoterrestris]
MTSMLQATTAIDAMPFMVSTTAIMATTGTTTSANGEAQSEQVSTSSVIVGSSRWNATFGVPGAMAATRRDFSSELDSILEEDSAKDELEEAPACAFLSSKAIGKAPLNQSWIGRVLPPSDEDRSFTNGNMKEAEATCGLALNDPVKAATYWNGRWELQGDEDKSPAKEIEWDWNRGRQPRIQPSKTAAAAACGEKPTRTVQQEIDSLMAQIRLLKAKGSTGDLLDWDWSRGRLAHLERDLAAVMIQQEIDSLKKAWIWMNGRAEYLERNKEALIAAATSEALSKRPSQQQAGSFGGPAIDDECNDDLPEWSWNRGRNGLLQREHAELAEIRHASMVPPKVSLAPQEQQLVADARVKPPRNDARACANVPSCRPCDGQVEVTDSYVKEAGEAHGSRKWLILLAMCVGIFLSGLAFLLAGEGAPTQQSTSFTWQSTDSWSMTRQSPDSSHQGTKDVTQLISPVTSHDSGMLGQAPWALQFDYFEVEPTGEVHVGIICSTKLVNWTAAEGLLDKDTQVMLKSRTVGHADIKLDRGFDWHNGKPLLSVEFGDGRFGVTVVCEDLSTKQELSLSIGTPLIDLPTDVFEIAPHVSVPPLPLLNWELQASPAESSLEHIHSLYPLEIFRDDAKPLSFWQQMVHVNGQQQCSMSVLKYDLLVSEYTCMEAAWVELITAPKAIRDESKSVSIWQPMIDVMEQQERSMTIVHDVKFAPTWIDDLWLNLTVHSLQFSGDNSKALSVWKSASMAKHQDGNKLAGLDEGSGMARATLMDASQVSNIQSTALTVRQSVGVTEHREWSKLAGLYYDSCTTRATLADALWFRPASGSGNANSQLKTKSYWQPKEIFEQQHELSTLAVHDKNKPALGQQGWSQLVVHGDGHSLGSANVHFEFSEDETAGVKVEIDCSYNKVDASGGFTSKTVHLANVTLFRSHDPFAGRELLTVGFGDGRYSVTVVCSDTDKPSSIVAAIPRVAASTMIIKATNASSSVLIEADFSSNSGWRFYHVLLVMVVLYVVGKRGKRRRQLKKERRERRERRALRRLEKAEKKQAAMKAAVKIKGILKKQSSVVSNGRRVHFADQVSVRQFGRTVGTRSRQILAYGRPRGEPSGFPLGLDWHFADEQADSDAFGHGDTRGSKMKRTSSRSRRQVLLDHGLELDAIGRLDTADRMSHLAEIEAFFAMADEDVTDV